MNFLKSILLVVWVALAGCHSSPNKFSDPVIIKIADFQDRRQTDSLIKYLLNKNPIYRIEAAHSLASVQDSTASLQLGTMLLEDPVADARRMAAFALGQTNGTASVNALIPALEDGDKSVLREVLEGLGKTIQLEDLQNLKNVKAQDSISTEGLAWAFYYVGLRGLADNVIIKKELEFLKPSYSLQTRLGAAHFFSRTSKLEISEGENLINAATSDKSDYVRMAAASGLRKLDSAKSISPLISIAKNDKDYRVRINAVRSLANWPIKKTYDVLLQALADSVDQVGIAAAEAIKPLPIFKDDFYRIARATKNTRIQSNLYKMLLTISDNDSLIQEIKDLYTSSANDYQKASLLLSLSASVKSIDFINEQLLYSKPFVIQSSAAQALVNASHNSGLTNMLKEKISNTYKQAILAGDPGVIGIIATALIDPALDYRKIIADYSFLTVAKKKLLLPKDIETLQPLEEAIAYFERTPKPSSLYNQFNHPIDWALVKPISKNQKIKIETTKGIITLKLLIEEAPGSVANFIYLLNQKYFDGKYFHRVVPNFVIQTGCNRGDGFGSEDYSIRSEFSFTRYKEGSVGMASAGKDTEGTQWFITHSPTPHLNGRYTIFAEVTEGMEVVRTIQVGDKINSVTLF